MAKEFFHRDMQLFIDHRFDWSRYFKLRRGDGVAVADEVATFKEVLRTTGEICQAIAEGARGHGEEVKLVDGRWWSRRTRRRLREAARRRAALSHHGPRIRRLWTAGAREHAVPGDGVARRLEPDDDHRAPGRRGARHREVWQRRPAEALPAALRVGRAAGIDGSDRAPGRPTSQHRHQAIREGDRYFIDGEDLHHERWRAGPSGPGARRRHFRAVEGNHQWTR